MSKTRKSGSGCNSLTIHCGGKSKFRRISAYVIKPLDKYDEFFSQVYQPGAMDVKTKHLVALAASLGAYEVGGFIVHFFSREKVEHLAKGYRLIGIDLLEEGPLPRKLFYVTLRKNLKKIDI